MIQRSSLTALWPTQAGKSSRTARTKAQQAMLMIALIAGVTLVLCLYLYQTSKITVKNYEIMNLESRYGRLIRENSNLLATYSYEQSITRMTARAEDIGFQPITSVLYLPVEKDAPAERYTFEAEPVTATDSADSTSISMREQ